MQLYIYIPISQVKQRFYDTLPSTRLLWSWIITSKPFATVNILTMPCIQLTTSINRNINIRNLDIIASARPSTTLEPTHVFDVIDHRALYIFPLDLVQLELGRVAILSSPTRVILALPRKERLLSQLANLDILHDNIRSMPDAATTTIGWISARHTSPRLEVRYVRRINKRDVLGVKVGNVLVSTVILAHRANSNTLSVVEFAVENGNIARVALESNSVVAIRDEPPSERDAVRVHCIATIRVQRTPLALGRIVDIDVIQFHALGVCNRHGPHLALHKAHPPDDRVGQLFEVDIHRPTG